MITTHFKKLLAVVVCLLTGITAQAQFKGAAEQYPTKDYSAAIVKFSLTEVATALGTDTATLAKAYNTWQDAEAWEGENLFWLIGANDAATDQPTADGKGFWMTAEGERIAYGEGAIWYAFAVVDVESDAFSFHCGQMPEVMKAGDSAKGKFQLRYNSKSVDFEVTLNVIEKPTVEIPDPMLLWKDLTIVDSLTQNINQKPRSGYDSDKVEVNLTEALVKLGLDGSLLKDELAQFLFAKKATLEDASVGAQMSDSLTNESSAGAPGFWLREVFTEDGDPTFECGRFGYDGDDAFYAEAFAFDAETGILSCNVGQMPNKLTGGNTYYTYIYVVYGDKAIKIRYNLVLEEVKLGTLEDYTEAGTGTIRVEMEPQNNYNTKDFSIDMEGICTALGCNVGDIDDFFMLKTATEFAGKNQEGVGYWVDKSGSVIAWGENAMFYITPKADDFSKFGIGQYPGHMTAGDSVRAYVYFLANSKYYQLGIDLVIKEPKQVDGVFESVAQRAIEVQQVPGTYVWTSGEEIPAAWVEEQLGTSDWVLYALDVLNEDGSEKEGNAKYTKAYTCDPNPGFWMDGEGHNVGWNKDATRVGITVASPSGKFSLMQHPGVALGDVFHFPIFLVNEDNGKMVTFNFTYSIVESVVQVEEVGKETLVVPVDKKGTTATLDLTKIVKALDTTVDELIDGNYLYGMTATGTYGGGVSVYDGLAFNMQGVTTLDDVAFYFEGAPDDETGNTLILSVYSNEEIADDFSAMGQMCFLVNGKRYVIELKFVSKNAYINTGIDEAQVSVVKCQPIFDLQGRKVTKAQRGLYIQNGKKYLVK